MKKETILFKKAIVANTTEVFTERIKDNGVIEELRIRFYPGVERSLEVEVYVNHKVRAREDLLSFSEIGEKTITGDDDYFIYPVSIPVEYDDDVVVVGRNKDLTYNYTLSVDVIISYDGEMY